MKSPELLVPAGNMESFKAAILGGADAIYLGGYKFGARNFAGNFSDEEIIAAIKIAHLYGIKIYVTINTIIYENEVNEFLSYVEFLHKNQVDAVIIQDVGMLDLVRKTYPNLEIHASTQMHIHNLEGVKLLDSLGVKRVVISRETDFLTIKNIKENTDIELEIFVHGALCISYSGQCLMSSLIGNRSGNRGSCAGSCRQKYDFIYGMKKLNHDSYLLSTKDLNSLENIGSLIEIGIDSFKLEGRMKSPSYVYMVTSLYRKAIDSYLKTKTVNITEAEIKDLKKIFNREFTKGFLFNTNNDDITNPFRPNHLGIEIGKVMNVKNGYATIKLTDELNINDGIRFLGNKDTGLIVTSMYKEHKKISNALCGDLVTIKINEQIDNNAVVLKTTDYVLNKKIENNLKNNSRKVLITGEINLLKNQEIKLVINDGKNVVAVNGTIVESAKTCPVSREKIKEQILKLGDTIYKFKELKINMDDNIFISIKELNDLRRRAIDLLNEKRLYKNNYLKGEYSIDVPEFMKEKKYTILIHNKEEYELIKNMNYQVIYIDNEKDYKEINDNRLIFKLDRVIDKYKDYDNKLLVGELGSLYKYKNVITDFSLNVVNSYSVAFLHHLGVDTVTLSYELDKFQIQNIIESYKERYCKLPNLELIVFGHEEVMISKFNLNEFFKVSGETYLKDRFDNMYPIVIKNNLMHIYNYKYRLLDEYEKYFDIGIHSLRFNVLDFNDIDVIKKELSI